PLEGGGHRNPHAVDDLLPRRDGEGALVDDEVLGRGAGVGRVGLGRGSGGFGGRRAAGGQGDEEDEREASHGDLPPHTTEPAETITGAVRFRSRGGAPRGSPRDPREW